MYAHIFGMERSAPGVPDPTIMSKHKMHACTGTCACRHTFQTVVEMKGKNQDNNKSKRTVKGDCISRIHLAPHLSRWAGPPRSRPHLWSLRWWSRRGPAALNLSQEDTAGCQACSLQLPLRTERVRQRVNLFQLNETVFFIWQSVRATRSHL